MKQGHLLLIFVIIYCSCFLVLYCEQKNYDLILEEKQRTEKALLEAIEYTANQYREVIKDKEEKKKQVIADAFSDAFYVSMGLFQTLQAEEFWRIHIPMLVLVEEEGAYFYYVKENTELGKRKIIHEWTDRITFDFPENCSDTKKKVCIADSLEIIGSQVISNHNFIAEQYGVSYRYSLPEFFQDTSQTLEFPMLFVVFQGWPLDASGTYFYENCLDAGVFLRERDFCEIEQFYNK